MEIGKMDNNFWNTGVEFISLVKEIWQEPTALKLETLRIKMNEEIKKQLKQHYKTEKLRYDYIKEIITRIQYTKEKLRFTVDHACFEDFTRTFLYMNFPQKLIKFDNTYLELLKYPEIWISSSEVNQ